MTPREKATLEQFDAEMAAGESIKQLRAIRNTWHPSPKKDRQLGAGTAFREWMERITIRHRDRVLTGRPVEPLDIPVDSADESPPLAEEAAKPHDAERAGGNDVADTGNRDFTGVSG